MSAQNVTLRPYQGDAIKAFFANVPDSARQLVACATGLGKTTIGAYVAGVWPEMAETLGLSARVLWLAHTTELVYQAVADLHRITGEEPAIEKAEMRASDGGELVGGARLVVGSVQTLAREARRMEFAPDHFGLIVCDEAHHAPCESYTDVFEYFQPSRGLGLTATPTRTDQISLGKVFDTVAYEYAIGEAIRDGWLSPIRQEHHEVVELDFSGIPPGAGDFTDAQIAQIVDRESPLHGIAAPTAGLVGDRQTIVFTPSVYSANKVAQFLRERYAPTRGAVAISGETPAEERKTLVEQYKRGEVQFLVNCRVCCEGFDAPRTSAIVIARPTKSIMLLEQMLGRGLRGGPLCPVEGKADCLVVDLCGDTGRHKLVRAVDLLGGKYAAEVIDYARQQCWEKEEAGEASDPVAELEEAASIADELQAIRRREIVAKAITARKTVDPFDVLDVPERHVAGWWDFREASEEQIQKLEAAGIAVEGDFDAARAKRLADHLDARRADGLCTFKQAKLLRKFGFSPWLSFGAAGKVIDVLNAGGWPDGPDRARELTVRKNRARIAVLELETVEAVIKRGARGGFKGLECRDKRGGVDTVKSIDPARRLWTALRKREVPVVDEAEQFV